MNPWKTPTPSSVRKLCHLIQSPVVTAKLNQCLGCSCAQHPQPHHSPVSRVTGCQVFPPLFNIPDYWTEGLSKCSKTLSLPGANNRNEEPHYEQQGKSCTCPALKTHSSIHSFPWANMRSYRNTELLLTPRAFFQMLVQ